MFIGGLNWETTDESLRQYFSQFGEVMDCVVMRDPSTGRSRGFGFLTMADHAAIDTIVSQDHYLDGKRIDPKRAIPREEQDKTEKIFVGGISPEVDEDEFRDFFTQFGKVIDATLMTDRDTGRPRGFGFITFEDSNGVEEALRRTDLAIKNKPIEVKKAMPKSKQMRQQQQGPFNQPFGGAGARGGYMPNTRYAGAANYGAQSRGNYGMGGMYPNMYGYGNYNMAAAYYGRGGGGSGGGNGNGYMGGNSYYGRGGGNGYDEGGDDDRDDQDSRREERRSKDRSSERTGTGGGALHASQARNQHHYRPY
ncbi:hypothetical protein BJV82DRAFT_600033 [Fennellomyces sp. T-0311]|nr:hypothetical protein BJV82DRAFT_600033 [Fennellomyces sp. T-0311]